MGIDIDAAEIVRRLVAWGQGRMDERLLWMFARKCGDCMDWAIDIAGKHDTNVTLWEGYYKGPTYTEFPVTHFFYNKNINLDYTYGNSEGIGNVALMRCFEEELKKAGVTLMYRTPAVQFIQDANKRVTGLIAGRPNNYTQINAAKGVIIATGCYGSNEEMRKAFAPYSLHADAQIYFPTKSNTGDAHIMTMQAGGVMQKNDNHAATVHLEAGAGSLFYGQMWQPWGNGWNVEIEKASQAQHIKDGKVVVADTLDELAQKMGVPVEALKATVTRYNELAAKGHDDDFGKRPELLTPIQKGPFYAGRLVSTLLAMSGGLHTDPSLHVLDKNDKPIEGLYVCGAAAGDYFGSGDYPTICPGMNHGRALTFGRLTGVMAAGGDIDKTVKSMEIK